MEETNEELKAYARACTEVLAILKEAPKEDIEKIPQDLLKALEEKSDKEYVFQTNSYMSLENEDLSDIAKVILMQIFKEYIFKINNEENETVIKKQNITEEISEELEEKVDESISETIENNVTETALVEVKKVPLYQKIINFFKKIFHIKGKEQIESIN